MVSERHLRSSVRRWWAAIAAYLGRSKALLVFSASALVSLAWGGHAAAESGAFGYVRLAADVLHLLAAGVWLGALIAFLRLIVQPSGSLPTTSKALASFSGVGSTVVAVLLGTGIVNAWHMVEWKPLPILTTSAWGWLLLAKLVLFAMMLGLATANRFWLTPRLQANASGPIADARRLRLSLGFETAMAVAVVALVSALGTLQPPVAG